MWIFSDIYLVLNITILYCKEGKIIMDIVFWYHDEICYQKYIIKKCLKISQHVSIKSFLNKMSLVLPIKTKISFPIFFHLRPFKLLAEKYLFLHEKVCCGSMWTYFLDNFQFISLFWHFLTALNWRMSETKTCLIYYSE